MVRFGLMLSFGAILLAEHSAYARQDPVGPSSGIVIHLFGPGSVTGIGGAPAGSPNGLATSDAGAAQGQGSRTTRGYNEPSNNEILRQMFVTGDPNEKPGQSFAKGRHDEIRPGLATH